MDWSNVRFPSDGFRVRRSKDSSLLKSVHLQLQQMLPLETMQLSDSRASNSVLDLDIYHMNAETHPASLVDMTAETFTFIRQLEEKCNRLEEELAFLRTQLIPPASVPRASSTEDPAQKKCIKSESSSPSGKTPSQRPTRRPSSVGISDLDGKRRKYVRKPKADPNGPVRPLTAYAAFANDVRKHYSVQGFSFAEIATCIGKDWQNMSAELRELYLTNAAKEKEKYDAILVEYAKTAQFAEHQKYVESFKHDRAKGIKAHGTPQELPMKSPNLQSLKNRTKTI